ncbi:MAG: Calx-beta domain-containing protein [Actinomycetota bacterium]
MNRSRSRLVVPCAVAFGLVVVGLASPAQAIAVADLSVTVADHADPVTAGNNVVYTVTAHDAGPSDAFSVTLDDVMPPGTTFVSGTQTSGPAFTLTEPPVGGIGTVSATIGTFADGATATFTYTFRVSSSLAGGTTLVNQPNISASGSSDPNGGNDSDSESTTIDTRANLVILGSSDDTDPVDPGAGVVYDTTVTNLGPSDAQTVQFTDIAPFGATPVGFNELSGPTFNLFFDGTSTFTATTTTFAAGATATFASGFTVDQDAPATLHHPTSISSTTLDPVPGNNADVEDTAVVPLISIDNVSLPEGDAGTTAMQFHVSLNHSFDAPIDVNFATTDGTATHPADFQQEHGTMQFSAGAVLETITVPANGERVFEPNEMFSVNLTLPPSQVGVLADAHAIGTIRNDDPRPTVSIGDVTHAEGDSGDTAFVLPVTLSNPSSQPVTVHYVSGGGTSTPPTDYDAVANDLVIPAGDSGGSVSVPVHGDTDVEPTENFAVSLSAPAGAGLGDSIGVGTIRNDDFADLVLSGSVSPGSPRVGRHLTETYTVKANGNQPDTDVTLVDTVSDRLLFVSAHAAKAGATCDRSGATVTCHLGSMAAGSQAVVTIVVIPTASGGLPVHGGVSGDAPEPTTANNAFTFVAFAEMPPCTITGTLAADTLAGTAGNDVICGLSGDDVLRGGGGDDVLVGGAGGDSLRGDGGFDVLLGGNDNDALDSRDGVSANDAASGGAGADTCQTDGGDLRVSCA